MSERVYNLSTIQLVSLSQPCPDVSYDLLIFIILLPSDSIIQGSKQMKVRSKIRAVGQMRKDSPSKLCDLSAVCRLVCGLMLSCWRRIWLKFLWGWTHLNHLFNFFRVSMYTSEFIVWLAGNVSIRITPPESQKNVVIILPAESPDFNFFLGEFLWSHSMDCRLASGSKWWIHVSSPVTILAKKCASASWCPSNSAQMVLHCSLCRQLGTFRDSLGTNLWIA